MDYKKILGELTPYKQGKQIREVKEQFGLERIVKLASNENPFGYSNRLDNLNAFSPSLEIYPDGYTAELRKALAEKLNVEENQLIFGNGSDEIITSICRAFLYPGVNTVMPVPSFPQYKHNALIEGAEIKEIPVVNGYHDLQAMLEAIDDKTNVVWLCSPNNPTGCAIPSNEFYSFLDQCPENVLVVLDEAYYEYLDKEKDIHALHCLSEYKNLLVLRTFSKAYGLAGLRIGYAIGNSELTAKLDVVRGPFNTSSIAQKAALIALEDDAFIAESISKNNKIKEEFQRFLDSIDWHYYDSETNFLFISTPISSEKVFEYLQQNGFIVRPAGEKTIRVTIGNETDMKQLQAIILQLNNTIKEEIQS
ncbi:histidinol-phosphate transaminase [Virgibacillus siamensis]|uniref:histidinol-phosphate transaminase n=1 Tax=Virgibacillus siamensis TaxID=480071 RepID=UPI0009864437|nr:histidinol-phosphate transaminase [Virgibacillus siamensis]